MLSICRRFKFDAAHRLPNHEGKCQRFHGHSFSLEVELAGFIKKEGPAKDMIIDFGELKSIVNETVIDNLDHYNLNEIYENPTAEVIVSHLKEVLCQYFNKSTTRLVRLRLYETDDNFVEWKENVK